MSSIIQRLSPDIQIHYNTPRYKRPYYHSPVALHMFIEAIQGYEPGISKKIEEMCGIYKNKDPKKPRNANENIYKHIKYKFKPTIQENTLFRKIEANVIRKWTIYICQNSTEVIYLDHPFKKPKRNKKGRKRKPRNQTYKVYNHNRQVNVQQFKEQQIWRRVSIFAM